MRKSLTIKQMGLYSELQKVAATDYPRLVMDGVAELSVARALQRRGLAEVDGRIVRPTPEAIEFRRGIAARQEEKIAA